MGSVWKVVAIFILWISYFSDYQPEVFVFYFGTVLIGAFSKMLRMRFQCIITVIDLFLYLFSFSFQSATSIRIGNLVGEGNIEKMKKVAILTALLIFIFQMIQISVLLAGRNVWGYIFTPDRVVIGIINMIYVLATFHPIDSLVNNFHGILVEIGKHKLDLLVPFIFFILHCQ